MAELARTVSESLVQNLVNAPAEGAGNASAVDDGSQTEAQREPLQRSTTIDANRQRFEDNRRQIAMQMVLRSCWLMICLWFLMLALVIATTWVYITGWAIYIQDADKKCDQPLRDWLLVMLLIPGIRFILTLLTRLSEGVLQQVLNGFLVASQVPIGYPILLIWGYILLRKCKTCQHTDPDLYHFVGVFFIYHVFQWCVFIVASCALVTIMFWIQRSGLLETGPGPHMAARQGLIDELETVVYNPNLFSEDPSAEKEPPECVCCLQAFDAEKPIKRTPCGHYFHADCLGTWLGSHARSCPLCRTDLQDAMTEKKEPAEPPV